MKTWNIQVQETFEKIVPVQAKTGNEAIAGVLDRYHSGRIYLKAEDLTDTRVDNYDTLDKKRAKWLKELILDWVGEHYGTHERENPCYSITTLAKHLVDKGV